MSPRLTAAARTPRSNKRRRAVLFTALALVFQFLVCQPNAAAQDTPANAPDDEEVVRVRTDLVVVPVYVTDGRGRRVSGLTRQDFQVRDNGRPVEIVHFAAGAERVALLFLLDASGSTREIVTQQSETALALFSRFGERSRVSVLQFRERPEQTLPFTRDLRAARDAFRIAPLANRRTAIFDAAQTAVGSFRAGAADAAERRIVVLISDGLDTASAASAASVVEEARAAGVSFYVIHVPLFAPRDGRLVARRPSRGFRDLAEKTGGQFFVVGDARSSLDPRAEHDLSPIFRAVAEDLQGQYVLGYHLAGEERGGKAHRVEVGVTRPGRFKVNISVQTFTLK